MTTDTECNVAIVGGGVAGCATALALARNGIRGVRILETRRGNAKRLGETIPPDTRTLLHRLGVWDGFLRQEHEPCLGSRSVWGSDSVGYNDFLLNPYGAGWHLDRAMFDGLLCHAALDAGVEISEYERFIDCRRTATGGFCLRSLTSNGARDAVAHFVVDATGPRSALARRLGSSQLFLDHLVFVYAFLEAPRPSAMTMVEAVRDGWWYAAAMPGQRMAVALATEAEVVRARRLHVRENWFAFLLHTNFLASQLDGCRLVCEELTVRAAGSFVLDRTAGPGWFAVGDAACTYDPISSAGIHKALSDGIRVADAIAASASASPGSPHEYDSATQAEFETYVANRSYLYALEQRWPDSNFWRRRQARSLM